MSTKTERQKHEYNLMMKNNLYYKSELKELKKKNFNKSICREIYLRKKIIGTTPFYQSFGSDEKSPWDLHLR